MTIYTETVRDARGFNVRPGVRSGRPKPPGRGLLLCQLRALDSVFSARNAANPSIENEGSCSPERARTETLPPSSSFCPTTSMYGTFLVWAVRIFAFMRWSDIDLDTVLLPKLRRDLFRVLVERRGDRNHDNLDWSEPDRERASKCSISTPKNVDRTEQRAVNHVRPFSLPSESTYVILKRSGSLKSNRIVVICTHGQRVLDLEIDLGAVERAAALVNSYSNPSASIAFERLARLPPHLVVADALFSAWRGTL